MKPVLRVLPGIASRETVNQQFPVDYITYSPFSPWSRTAAQPAAGRLSGWKFRECKAPFRSG
jgi:hypothetical protein